MTTNFAPIDGNCVGIVITFVVNIYFVAKRRPI